MNVRKQHLSQNDVALLRSIDLDPGSRSWMLLAPRLDSGHCYGEHHRLAKIWPGLDQQWQQL